MDLYYRRLKLKLNRFHQHLNFLLTCREFSICPKFLQIINKPRSKQHFDTIRKTEQILLNAEIREIRKKLSFITREVKQIHLRFIAQYDPRFVSNFFLNLNIQLKKESDKINLKHSRKLDALLKNNRYGARSKFIEKPHSVPFINLANYKFTFLEKQILTKGPSFIFDVPLNKKFFVADFENILKNVSEVDAQKYRAIMYTKLNKPQKIPKQLLKVIKSLRNNPAFKILKADKNNQLVIMSTDDYNLKVQDTLHELKAKKINKDLTDKLIRELAGLKKQLHELNRNDLNFPDFLYKAAVPPLYPAAPNMFFRVKTHKQNNPLRPIVAKNSSPTYNLEKALQQFLAPYFKDNKFNIKSTLGLFEDLQKLNIDPNDKLFSFDVISLFPSVPINIAIDIILKKLKNFYTEDQLKVIHKALNFVLRNNYFKVLDDYYLQEDGCPMGSPLSGLIADIVLNELETALIELASVKPKYYGRFVDDIILIWSHSLQKLEELFSRFNSFFPTLFFTKEVERNGILNFLDLTITRSNNKLSFSVFHKPDTQITPIHSKAYTALRYKKSFFVFHFRRALLFSTEKSDLDKEVRYIFEKGFKAGYSKAFLNDILFSVSEGLKSRTPKHEEENDNTKPKFFILQYDRNILPVVNDLAKKYNLKIALKNKPSLFNLIRKDGDPRNNRVGGIYSIPLLDENNVQKQYIGRTKRNITKRIAEHKRSLMGQIPTTELSKSVLLNNMKPIFDNVKIIYAPRNEYQLNFLESLEILKSKFENNNVVNERLSFDIPPLWATLNYN